MARWATREEMEPESFRSEEHTSELQSQFQLVCRLLLEKKTGAHLPALLLDQARHRRHRPGPLDQLPDRAPPRRRPARRERAGARQPVRRRAAPRRRGRAGRLNVLVVFFFNVTATTEIYTLSLHDALPI